jgi:hypothetical protein
LTAGINNEIVTTMTISIRTLVIGCAAIALCATAFIGVPTAGANHSWGGYHWDKQAPFTLVLGDNVTSTWDSYLSEAVADWQSSVVLDTKIAPGNTNFSKGRNTPKSCTPTAGRVEVCNAKYGANGWLGIASIWTSGTHITAGSVKLNDTYFSTATYNKPDWRGLVMCQEVAHTFGLAHQDETFNNFNLGSCMDYTNAPGGGVVGGFDYGPTNRYPNTHDFVQLEVIYAHLVSGSTASPTMALEDSEDPQDWGRETHRTADGRHSTFEKDLGNGKKVIRDVFWAEPRGNGHNDRH